MVVAFESSSYQRIVYTYHSSCCLRLRRRTDLLEGQSSESTACGAVLAAYGACCDVHKNMFMSQKCARPLDPSRETSPHASPSIAYDHTLLPRTVSNRDPLGPRPHLYSCVSATAR